MVENQYYQYLKVLNLEGKYTKKRTIKELKIGGFERHGNGYYFIRFRKICSNCIEAERQKLRDNFGIHTKIVDSLEQCKSRYSPYTTRK